VFRKVPDLWQAKSKIQVFYGKKQISGLDEFGYEVYVVLRVHKSKERVNVAPT